MTVARCLYVDIRDRRTSDLMEPRLTSIIACSIFNSPDHSSSTDGTVVLVYLSENSCITSALSSPCAAACVSVTSGAKDVDACYLLKPSCHYWAAIYRVLLVKSGHQQCHEGLVSKGRLQRSEFCSKIYWE